MKIFEIASKIPKLIYHSTSDKNAIFILRSKELDASVDSIDEFNEESFISTTSDPNLLFFGSWPGTGNIQFVFDTNNLITLGYEIKPFEKRWNEFRIYLSDQDSFPINNKTVHHISIHDNVRYFKGWAQDIDVDSRWGEEEYSRLKKSELNPRGEFVGSENPYGIIKMLGNKLGIPVVDKRIPKK